MSASKLHPTARLLLTTITNNLGVSVSKPQHLLATHGSSAHFDAEEEVKLMADPFGRKQAYTISTLVSEDAAHSECM